MKKILMFLLMMFVMIPVYSQNTKDKNDSEIKEKEDTTKKSAPKGKIYFELAVEDFESNKYDESNMKFPFTKSQQGGLAIRDQFPSPQKNSKKYLGIKIFGRMGDVVTIVPPKKLIIDKHCKTIAMWVYGKNISGELSIMVRDANGDSHRLIMGRLDYRGWKQLKANLSSKIVQMDRYLNKKQTIEITRIMYNPGNTGRVPMWNYFYIDDITAIVREKIYDKQSDEW